MQSISSTLTPLVYLDCDRKGRWDSELIGYRQLVFFVVKKAAQIRGGGGGGSLEHLTPGGDREPAFQSRVSLGVGGGRPGGT